MEQISDYTFDRGKGFGYSVLTVWKGPKMYSAVVLSETGKGHQRKEMRGRDWEGLCLRGMAIIERLPRSKLVLIDSWGRPIPFKVRTEDDEIKDIVRESGILVDIRKNIVFGPEYQIGGPDENGGRSTLL